MEVLCDQMLCCCGGSTLAVWKISAVSVKCVNTNTGGAPVGRYIFVRQRVLGVCLVTMDPLSTFWGTNCSHLLDGYIYYCFVVLLNNQHKIQRCRRHPQAHTNKPCFEPTRQTAPHDILKLLCYKTLGTIKLSSVWARNFSYQGSLSLTGTD